MKMQTITVKYLGPTNTKPSRLKATASNGMSVTVQYQDPDETNEWQGYNRAARTLRDKLGWTGAMVSGSLGCGSDRVYIFEDEIKSPYRI